MKAVLGETEQEVDDFSMTVNWKYIWQVSYLLIYIFQVSHLHCSSIPHSLKKKQKNTTKTMTMLVFR